MSWSLRRWRSAAPAPVCRLFRARRSAGAKTAPCPWGLRRETYRGEGSSQRQFSAHSGSLAFTICSFPSKLLCRNQSSCYFPPPLALPTLLQYYCRTIVQYTTPPDPPFLCHTPYTILAIAKSCGGQAGARCRWTLAAQSRSEPPNLHRKGLLPLEVALERASLCSCIALKE